MEQTPAGVLQAAANWVWLIPDVRFGHAIFVGRSDASVLDSLRLLFDRVTEHPETDRVPHLAGLVGAADVAYLDLVFLAQARLPLDPLLAALRTALDGGGHLCLASGCENGSLRARMRALRRLRTAARGARRRGFRDFRRYYAHPSLRAPRAFLPATRLLTAAVERMAEPVPNRAVRLALAGCGLHELLYRGHLSLCSA